MQLKLGYSELHILSILFWTFQKKVYLDIVLDLKVIVQNQMQSRVKFPPTMPTFLYYPISSYILVYLIRYLILTYLTPYLFLSYILSLLQDVSIPSHPTSATHPFSGPKVK